MRFVLTLLAIAPAFAQFSTPAPIFSKLFGGSAGTDVATALAVDQDGNVVVVGTTDSPDFPVTSGAYQSTVSTPPLAAVTATGVDYPSIGAVNITAFAASSDNSVIYANSISGIYRSTDDGATWTRQYSTLSGTTSIAVDGANSNVVYAAADNPPIPGALNGLFKSTDSGITWTEVSSRTGTALYAPTRLTGVLYLVAGGIYTSTNGGSTWSANLAPDNYNVFAIALAPSDPSVLYTVASDGNLYRSSDGGNTWTAPGGSFTAYPNANSYLYIANLAVDSQNENMVWAVNQAGTLWRSIDGGATFSIVQQIGNNPQGRVYFSISGSNIIAGQMLSFDGGSTWSALPFIAYETAALATPGAILIGAGSGAQDFLTKWSSDGIMLFSTFLPASPSGLAPVMVSDSSGDTWVAGGSLMKFDPSGKELLSQSLSGLTPRAMTLDPSGNVYVAANYYGDSTDCNTPASQNGSIPVLMKFSSQGNPIYSNPLPQLCPGFVHGILADASGAVYLAGSATSTSLSTTSTALQPTAPTPPPSNFTAATGTGFLAIVSPSGADTTYLSYLGGGLSAAAAIALDSSGNIYITGNSVDTSFPVTATADFQGCPQTQDRDAFAFVIKLSRASSTPIWIDEIGACAPSGGTQIALDSAGNVWTGGTTSSAFFPTLSPFELQGRDGGFLSELSPDGENLLLSSYSPGLFALGPGNTLYLAGAESPNPPKVGPVPSGDPIPTSAFVEAYTLSGYQASVIDSIPSLQPSNGDPNPQYLGIAPGELIYITGRGLGPSTAIGAQLGANGRITSSLGEISVLFNGVAAPILSVQENSIVCMAPFELDGQTTALIQIQQNGATTPGVLAGVKPVSLSSKVLAVVNVDGTLNSQSNPAQPGQPVILYVSGFGDTNPSVPDGSVYQSPLPVPIYPVIGFGGTIAYAGPAPCMVAGIWQVNLTGLTSPGVGGLATAGLSSSATIGPDEISVVFSVWIAP